MRDIDIGMRHTCSLVCAAAGKDLDLDLPDLDLLKDQDLLPMIFFKDDLCSSVGALGR